MAYGTNTHKGKYKVKNPEKYKGDVNSSSTCQICQYKCNSLMALAHHIGKKHKEVNLKDYYINNLGEQKYCEICDSPASFVAITVGFRATCCRSCAAIRSKKNLKNNEEAYNSWLNTMSDVVKKQWKEEDQSQRIANIAKTNRKNNEKLTKEQLSEKYAWQNKLTKEELDLWKKEVMIHTGMFKWWAEATEEQKLEVYAKRADTLFDNPNFKIPISKKNWHDEPPAHLMVISEAMIKSLDLAFGISDEA